MDNKKKFGLNQEKILSLITPETSRQIIVKSGLLESYDDSNNYDDENLKKVKLVTSSNLEQIINDFFDTLFGEYLEKYLTKELINSKLKEDNLPDEPDGSDEFDGSDGSDSSEDIDGSESEDSESESEEEITDESTNNEPNSEDSDINETE